MISRSFLKMNRWWKILLIVDGIRSWSMSERHELILASWFSIGIPRSVSRTKDDPAVDERFRLPWWLRFFRWMYRSHVCIPYPAVTTPKKPKLGYHNPKAIGESFAKNNAVENKMAKIVQNLFSNSCAWWTPCDSLEMNIYNVYNRVPKQVQKIGATAKIARIIRNEV